MISNANHDLIYMNFLVMKLMGVSLFHSSSLYDKLELFVLVYLIPDNKELL